MIDNNKIMSHGKYAPLSKASNSMQSLSDLMQGAIICRERFRFSPPAQSAGVIKMKLSLSIEIQYSIYRSIWTSSFGCSQSIFQFVLCGHWNTTGRVYRSGHNSIGSRFDSNHRDMMRWELTSRHTVYSMLFIHAYFRAISRISHKWCCCFYHKRIELTALSDHTDRIIFRIVNQIIMIHCSIGWQAYCLYVLCALSLHRNSWIWMRNILNEYA